MRLGPGRDVFPRRLPRVLEKIAQGAAFAITGRLVPIVLILRRQGKT